MFSKETLTRMIEDYSGLELSEEELENVRIELENYMGEVQKLRELDLSHVMSSRLLRAEEGRVSEEGQVSKEDADRQDRK